MPSGARGQLVCPTIASTVSLDGCSLPQAPWTFGCSAGGTAYTQTIDGNCFLVLAADSEEASCVGMHPDAALADAPAYAVEARLSFSKYFPGCNSCTIGNVSILDGSHAGGVVFAVAGDGSPWVGLTATQDLWAPLDWSTPRTYRLEVDRSGNADLLVDGAPTLSVPYAALSPAAEAPAIELFAGQFSESLWDYVTWEVCGETAGHAPPGSSVLELSAPRASPQPFSPLAGPVTLTASADVLNMGGASPHNKNFHYYVSYSFSLLDSFTQKPYATIQGRVPLDFTGSTQPWGRVRVPLNVTWDGAMAPGVLTPDGTYPFAVTAQVVRTQVKSGAQKIVGAAQSAGFLAINSVRLSAEQQQLLAAMQAITASYPPGAELPWADRVEYAKLQSIFTAGGSAALEAQFQTALNEADAEMSQFGASLTPSQLDEWHALHLWTAGLAGVRWDPVRATPAVVTLAELRPVTGTLESEAVAFMSDMALLAGTGPGDQFPVRDVSAGDGGVVVRLGHEVDGVPVLGDSVSVAVRSKSDGNYLTGLVSTIGRDLGAVGAQKSQAIPEALARAAAEADFRAANPGATGVTSQASLAILANSAERALVFQVLVESAERDVRAYLIDALDGTILNWQDPSSYEDTAYLMAYVPRKQGPRWVLGRFLGDLVPLSNAWVVGCRADGTGCVQTTTRADGSIPTWPAPAPAYYDLLMCGPEDVDLLDHAQVCGEFGPFSPGFGTIYVGWPVEDIGAPTDTPYDFRVVGAQSHYVWEHAFWYWYMVPERRDVQIWRHMTYDPGADWAGRAWQQRIDLNLALSDWPFMLATVPLHEFGHVQHRQDILKSDPADASREGFANYCAKVTSDFGAWEFLDDGCADGRGKPWDWSYYRPESAYSGDAGLQCNGMIWAGTYTQIHTQIRDKYAARLALLAAQAVQGSMDDEADLVYSKAEQTMWLNAATLFPDYSYTAAVDRAYFDHGGGAFGCCAKTAKAGGPHAEYPYGPRVVQWAAPLSPDNPQSSTVDFPSYVSGFDFDSRDWFNVWVEKGYPYEFSTTTLPGEAMYDTVLTLFQRDPGANRTLASNDDWEGGSDPRASRIAWTADYSGWAYLEVKVKGSPPLMEAGARVVFKRTADQGAGSRLETTGWPLHRSQVPTGLMEQAFATLYSGQTSHVYRFPWYQPTPSPGTALPEPSGRCDRGFKVVVHPEEAVMEAGLTLRFWFTPNDPANGATTFLGEQAVPLGTTTSITVADASSPYYRPWPGIYRLEVERRPARSYHPIDYWLVVWDKFTGAMCQRGDESDRGHPFDVRRKWGTVGDILPEFHNIAASFYGLDPADATKKATDEDYYRIHLNRGETLTVALQGFGVQGTLDVTGPVDMDTGDPIVDVDSSQRAFDQSRSFRWTSDAAATPLTVVAPRDGDYVLRARPRSPGGKGFYTVSFRLHPWTNVDAPGWPVK